MPAINSFREHSYTRAGGPANLAVVTPSDIADLTYVSQCVYIGVVGALRVTTNGGQIVTTPSLHVGWHLMEIARIHETGTTASEIMVGW